MKCGINAPRNCGCNGPITDWYALENSVPKNPFDAIAFASFAGVDGVFEYSSDFIGTNAATTPLSLAAGGIVETWATDSGQMVGDAQMYTMQHKMVNVSSSVPPPLHKLAFVRSGIQWKNTLLIDVGVDLDYMQLSFLENAGTRGDAQGQVPVIKFDGPIVNGQHILVLTLEYPMAISLGLMTLAAVSGDKAMMELDLVAE